MAKQTTEIALKRNTAIALASVVSQPCLTMIGDTIPVGSYLLGFDPSGPDGERLLYSADDNATREANQHFSEPFYFTTWACKKVLIRDSKTGGEVPAVRTVLFDPEFETLAFVSEGALASLDMIRTRKGDGPYDPPIPVVVKEVKTRAGWRIYKIIPVSALRDSSSKK